jgi:hypothetical protein
MNNRVVRLALALAIIGVVLVGVTAVARAQVAQPEICRDPGRYDMNGDGVVDRLDVMAWKNAYLAARGDDCNITTGKTEGCPASLDLDGNGVVDTSDAGAQIQIWMMCIRPSAFVNPGG